MVASVSKVSPGLTTLPKIDTFTGIVPMYLYLWEFPSSLGFSIFGNLLELFFAILSIYHKLAVSDNLYIHLYKINSHILGG